MGMLSLYLFHLQTSLLFKVFWEFPSVFLDAKLLGTNNFLLEGIKELGQDY